jgi:hypothetical protein
MEEMRNVWENLKGRNPVENLGVDGRVLKWTL